MWVTVMKNARTMYMTLLLSPPATLNFTSWANERVALAHALTRITPRLEAAIRASRIRLRDEFVKIHGPRSTCISTCAWS